MSVLLGTILALGQAGAVADALESAQVYAVVYERELTGTGFLIRFEGETYAVSAIPEGASSPLSLAALDGGEVQLGPRVYADAHVQVQRIERRLSDRSEPFKYDGAASLQDDEELAVVGLYDVAHGTLHTSSVIEADVPSRAQDIRGSPVVSLRSGAVVGVVTTADDEEQASRFTFVPFVFDGEPRLDPTHEMLVGTWASGFGAMVTELELRPDRSFVAKYLVSGSFVGKVEGQWKLRGRELIWTYEKDNGLVPSDREDVNRIIELSRDRFSVRETDGRTSVFTRK